MTPPTPMRRLFRVVFHNQGQVWELYCRQVEQGNLLGFVLFEEILFGEKSQLVVDPSEEKLRTELAGVRRCHVPIHAVIRIDEVEKEGTSRITALPAGETGNLARFPSPILARPPGGDKPKG